MYGAPNAHWFRIQGQNMKRQPQNVATWTYSKERLLDSIEEPSWIHTEHKRKRARNMEDTDIITRKWGTKKYNCLTDMYSWKYDNKIQKRLWIKIYMDLSRQLKKFYKFFITGEKFE